MNSPLRIPLMFSLVLNLLLVGLVAGHFLRAPDALSPSDAPMPQSLDAIEEVAVQLPAEKAQALRQVMASAKAATQTQKDEMKAARERTTEILRTEPFDAAAYQQEVSRLHELRGQMMQEMANATMQAAAGLNAEERSLLANTFKRYHGYWRKCAPPDANVTNGSNASPPPSPATK